MDVKTLFMDPIYFKLFATTIGFFVAGYLIWLMYIALSKKDLFSVKKSKSPTSWDKFVYVTKYGLLFPIYSSIWFLVFVVCLYFLSDKYAIETILFIGVVLVTVIRIFAYINERLAEDFAKLIPLTLISILIMDPTFIKLNPEAFTALVQGLYKLETVQFLIFLIVSELLIRTIAHIFDHFKTANKN